MTWKGSPHAGTQLTTTTAIVKPTQTIMTEQRVAWIHPVDSLRSVVAKAVLLRQLCAIASAKKKMNPPGRCIFAEPYIAT